MSDLWTTVITAGGSIIASAFAGFGAAHLKPKPQPEQRLSEAPPVMTEAAVRALVDAAVKAALEQAKAEFQRELGSARTEIASIRSTHEQAQRDGQARWDQLMRSVGRIEGMLEADK